MPPRSIGPPPDHKDQRIVELEAALRQERERLTVALRRAELLEAACKNAYRMAAGGRPQRRDEPEPGR